MSRRLVKIVVGIGAMAFGLAGCFTNGTTATNTGVAGQPGAGLYRTLGDQGGACTVTRTDAANTAHVYSNETGGPLYIRVEADDKSVTSKNCEPWLLAAFVRAIFLPGADFVSGDFRVNYEVLPGNYASSGTPANSGVCTWQRVSDFTHDGQGVILATPGSQTDTHGTVTIANGDFGFTSQNCGTWHRTGP